MNSTPLTARILGLLIGTLILAACSTVEEVQPDLREQANVDSSQTLESAAVPLSGATPTTLRESLAAAGAAGTPFQFDALRLPAGNWDGYVQASGGSFLQCLVAWGPREARLGISAGWDGSLFAQFRAPDWPVADLINQTDLVVAVDELYQRSVPLEGNGQLMWVNLGATPDFAQSLIDGEQLTLRVGNHVMVYPLADADLAMQGLYECLALQTEQEGNGGLSLHGIDLTTASKSNLTETAVRALLESGFGDVLLREPNQTAEQYGSRVLLSGPAWGGEAELFVSVFGLQGDSKKALEEAVNDAARLCREEVQARLVRMEESTSFGQFGRYSLLCAGETGEFVLETLAFFDGRNILVIHAIVDDVNERARIDGNFERMMARMSTTS